MNLTLPKACHEFGVSRETIARGLRGIGEDVEPRRAYTIRTIHRALLGDGKAERARLTRAQADREEMEVAQLKGELVSLDEVTGIIRRVIGPIRDFLVAIPLSEAAACNPADPRLAEERLRSAVDNALRGLREDALPKAINEHETERDEGDGPRVRGKRRRVRRGADAADGEDLAQQPAEAEQPEDGVSGAAEEA